MVGVAGSGWQGLHGWGPGREASKDTHPLRPPVLHPGSKVGKQLKGTESSVPRGAAAGQLGSLARPRHPRPVPLPGLMRTEPGGGRRPCPGPKAGQGPRTCRPLPGRPSLPQAKHEQPGGSGTPSKDPALTLLTSGRSLLRLPCCGLRGARVSRTWGRAPQPPRCRGRLLGPGTGGRCQASLGRSEWMSFRAGSPRPLPSS